MYLYGNITLVYSSFCQKWYWWGNDGEVRAALQPSLTSGTRALRVQAVTGGAHTEARSRVTQAESRHLSGSQDAEGELTEKGHLAESRASSEGCVRRRAVTQPREAAWAGGGSAVPPAGPPARTHADPARAGSGHCRPARVSKQAPAALLCRQ